MNPTNSKLRFSEPASIGIEGVKKINIRTEGGKLLVISTEKCFSHGLRKDEMYNSTSMSLVLDDVTTGIIEAIIAQCEKHLEKPLLKTLYRRDDRSATIYTKLDASKGEILTTFYEDGEVIDPMKYEGKRCDVKAIGGIILSEKGARLQVKIYEAMVRPKVYERVRLLSNVKC